MVAFLAYIAYTSGFDSILYPIIKPTWLYRIIQKILEGLGLYIVYTFSGIDGVTACLITHYAMTMDYLFYIYRNEMYVVEAYEATLRVPKWLSPQWLYFSGSWLFPPFTVNKFKWSAIAGVVLGLIVIYFKIASFIITFLMSL